MSHHNFDPKELERQQREMRNLAQFYKRKLPNFGTTGRFPEGRLTEDDEGEIRFGVAVTQGKVLIDFGKPTHSLGLNPQQARELGESLLSGAEEAERQETP